MAEQVEWDETTGIAQEVDWTDRDPGEPVPLTDEQKAAVRSRIRQAIAALTTQGKHFNKAMNWVCLIYEWQILQTDPDAPEMYGARFADFASFIARRAKDREAMEVLEGEDAM